jgi:peptidoglycan DL-endopeptidase CwlO
MLAQPSRVTARIAALAAWGLLIACAGQEPGSPQEPREPVVARAPAPGQSVGERAAVIAVRQVGVPYRYGGNGVDGFDCSGLVHYAYARAGKTVPRTTGDLWHRTRPVSGGELEAGDVLFFDIEGKVSHVGLYLGSGRFVHAPSTGREVTVADLHSGYYQNAFIRGGRPQ